MLRSWWRVVDGVVSREQGFAFADDPDVFYFNDETSEHVDCLYEDEAAARAAAVVYLHEKVRAYEVLLNYVAKDETSA